MRNRQASIDRRAAIRSEGELTTLKDLYRVADKYHKGKTAFEEAVRKEIVSYSFDQYIRDVGALGTCLKARVRSRLHGIRRQI